MFEKFRQSVKDILKTQKLTYCQLSTKACISESTIKQFMCGASDSRRVAEKIANSLDCALRYENGQYFIIENEVKRTKDAPKNPISSLGKLIKVELIKRNKTQNWLISELKKRLPTMYIDSSALNKILTGKIAGGKIVDEIHSILNI